MCESEGKTSPRKVLGDLGNLKPDPVSPTANLKLLTTLASNLKSLPNDSTNTSYFGINKNFTVQSDTGNQSEYCRVSSRKEKSLHLLCNKFLSLYPMKISGNGPQEIPLDKTAKLLRIEKRRIYDIINVLECVNMATKTGKNLYLWHGQEKLIEALLHLKTLAIKLGIREQIQSMQKKYKAYIGDTYESNPNLESPVVLSQINDKTINGKEEKSLGIMCQRFIMLFLVSLKNGVINLDIAAKVLITDYTLDTCGHSNPNIGSNIKTKVRRLYDISNVLSAIGLIQKVEISDTAIRKPVFIYTGPDLDLLEYNTGVETPLRENSRRSLIGMVTPTKNNFSRIEHKNHSPNLITAPRRILPKINETPSSDRRDRRKRKLFGSDVAGGRSFSSPCLDSGKKLDNSILQVAEIELKKLKTDECEKSEVSAKLFPRHHSDSCITVETSSPNGWNNVNNSPLPNSVQPSACTTTTPQVFHLNNTNNDSPKNDETSASKQTLVKKYIYNTYNIIHVTASNSTEKINITTPESVKNVRIPTVVQIPTIQVKNVVPTSKSETLKKCLVLPNQNQAKTPQMKVKQPKFVTLTNFNNSKLIPLIRTQGQTPTLQLNACDNTIKTISIPQQVFLPPNTFKAIKYGNAVQLVPVEPKSDGNNR